MSEKWADYIITGIWISNKNERRYISHVLLHQDEGSTLSQPGAKQDKDFVIALLKTKTIVTAKWDYYNGRWSIGAFIDKEFINGEYYLKTAPDGNRSNNLNNLPRMNFFT